MSDELLIDRQGAVAVLTLNRPDRLNALNDPMVDAMTAAFEALTDDTDVRAIVLTGAGRGFCSGADLKDNQINKGTWWSAFRVLNFDQHPIARIRRYAKPLIAAVNGVAIGGGLGIALAADLRIGSHSARFCAPFVRHGMTPVDAVAALLPDAVGVARTMDMIMTGRMVESDEALAWGLISERVEDGRLIDRALELAQHIAAGPPVALALAKQVVYRGLGLPIDQQMALQSMGTFTNKAYAQNDMQEALSAFAERRPPRFTGT
ncbi:MAG TPA: enoyl-CoA hydratase/isomerase family protein [Novosphingobium sp.]